MPTTTVGGPLPKEARQGRQNQKYGESGERLLAGCIPFRIVDDSNEANRVEILLVTRRNSDGWIFPKGGWESDENEAETAALRETVEEAGVRGNVDGPVIGAFEFTSKKRSHIPDNKCLAYVFAMRVEEQLDEWPERLIRNRQWFKIGEAYNRCKYEWMRDALQIWIERNNWSPLLTNGVQGGVK